MRILITGASGFIGSELSAGLLGRGHAVVAAVRDSARTARKWPQIEVIPVDFNVDTSVATWCERLTGIDAVVNCAGVLHGGRGQNMEAIHALAPIALFDACVRRGVRRVVQVSAISADDDAGTDYATTKKRADDHLRSLPLAWTVLRPSLVYGDGSYGGTSALRGLAGLPIVTPTVGDGSAAFRPIHIADLVETVIRTLEEERGRCMTLEPVGPQRLTLREIVGRYRGWLGLPAVPMIPIPLPILRVTARLADLSGGGPMGTMALRQLMVGNAGHEPPGVFETAIGFRPAAMTDRLAKRPAQTQDLWHARLYFLRPLLRTTLALMWLGSAIVGLITPVEQYSTTAEALGHIGLDARALAVGFSGVDLAIAISLLIRYRPRLVAAAQLVLVLSYTLGLGILDPVLWADPFGGLLKNLPILAAILTWAVLEEER